MWWKHVCAHFRNLRLRTYIICAQKSTMFAHISKLTFAHILCWKHHYIRFAALNVYHTDLAPRALTGEHLILIWRLVPWLENTSYWSGASCLDWRTPHTDLAPHALTGEHFILIWRLVPWLENTSYWSGASCLDWRTPHTDLAPRALTGEHLILI